RASATRVAREERDHRVEHRGRRERVRHVEDLGELVRVANEDAEGVESLGSAKGAESHPLNMRAMTRVLYWLPKIASTRRKPMDQGSTRALTHILGVDSRQSTVDSLR